MWGTFHARTVDTTTTTKGNQIRHEVMESSWNDGTIYCATCGDEFNHLEDTQGGS